MKFDVHRAGMIGGEAIGPFLQTIEAPDHRAAKELAEQLHRGRAVVVLPHRKSTDKLERALRQLERIRRRG